MSRPPLEAGFFVHLLMSPVYATHLCNPFMRPVYAAHSCFRVIPLKTSGPKEYDHLGFDCPGFAQASRPTVYETPMSCGSATKIPS